MRKLVLMCVILINIGRADTPDFTWLSQLCVIQNTGQSAYKQLTLTSQRVLLALQEQNPNMLMQALKEQVKSYQMVINFTNQTIEMYNDMNKDFTLIIPEQKNPLNKVFFELQETIQWFQEVIRSTQNNISIYQTYRSGEEFLRIYYDGQEFFLDLIQYARQKLEVIEAELKSCDMIQRAYK